MEAVEWVEEVLGVLCVRGQIVFAFHLVYHELNCLEGFIWVE